MLKRKINHFIRCLDADKHLINFIPCKYGKNLHIISPNTKSRSKAPISVNGIQSTPSSMSDTAKFSKNTLVMVRIRRFCTNVMITKKLPTIANKRIVAYKGICTRPDDSHDGTDDDDDDDDGAKLGEKVEVNVEMLT